MNHVIQLPDDVYQAIKDYAAQHAETPETAIRHWAESLRQQTPEDQLEPSADITYDPADDPLAEFLGKGELTEPDAILRHDEVIAEEAFDAHRE